VHFTSQIQQLIHKKKSKEKGLQTTFEFTEVIPVFLTMSCISYKIQKLSPYTPWHYKFHRMEKKKEKKKNPESVMSLKWYKNNHLEKKSVASSKDREQHLCCIHLLCPGKKTHEFTFL